jgi:hypothetical protein
VLIPREHADTIPQLDEEEEADRECQDGGSAGFKRTACG